MSQSIQLFFTILLSQFCQPNKLFDERNQTLLAAAYDSLLRRDLLTKKAKFVDTDNDSDDGKPNKEFKKRRKVPKSYRYKGKKYAAYFGNQHHQVLNNVAKVLKNDKSYSPEKSTQSKLHVHKKYHSNNTDTQIPLKDIQERNYVTTDINHYSESSNRVQKRDLYFKSIQPDSENYEEFPAVTDKVDDVQINELYYFSRDDTIDDADIDFIEAPKPELSIVNIINMIMKDKHKKAGDHDLRFPNGYWNRSKMQSPSTVIAYIKNFSLKPKIYHRVALLPNVTLRKNTSRMISLLNKNYNQFQHTKRKKTTINIKSRLKSTKNNSQGVNVKNKYRKIKNNKPEGSIPVLTDLDLDADKFSNVKTVKLDSVDIEANEENYFADDRNRRKSIEQNSKLLIYKVNCGYENNLYKSTESLHNCRKRGSYVNKDNILSIDYENPHIIYPSTTDYNTNDNRIRTMNSTSQSDFNTNKIDSEFINYNILKNLAAEEPKTERVNNDINGTVRSNAPNKDEVKETDDKDSSTRSHINQEGNITLRSEYAVEKKKNHSYKDVSEKRMYFLKTQGLATETYMVIASKPVAIFLTNNVLIEETATIKPEGMFPSRTVTTSNVPSLSKCPFSKQTYTEPSTLKAARSRRDNFNNIWSCYDCGLNATGFGTTLCHAIFENDFDKKFHTRRRFRRTCTGDPRYHGQCFKRYLDIGNQYNERGCRDWPPVPGYSFASNRLTTLEYLLKDVANGCVASPQAMLVRFSRSVRLYARLHVCVCSGELCNVAGTCQVDFLVGSLVLWVFLLK